MRNPTTGAHGSVWEKPIHLRSRRFVALVGGTCFFVLAVFAEKPPKDEYKIKAEFLYNFAKLVEWPTNAFANASTPLTIGVVGGDSFESLVREVVEGKKVGDRKLVVRQCVDVESAIGCQVLFFHNSAHNQESAILRSLSGRSVLTVGETGEFLQHGGMIHFMLVEGAVRFEVYLDAAEKEGLQLSSKLLLLSRPVYRPPGPKERD